MAKQKGITLRASKPCRSARLYSSLIGSPSYLLILNAC